MKDKLKDSVSDSLEAGSLLPYMPYLLQDLWSLGSSVEQIVKAVRELKLDSDKTKVLDLGCGKGAVSVNLAAGLGFKVTGIDAMESFLEDARVKAMEFKVEHLCIFINRDILDFVKHKNDFDIVILAALGGILGSVKDTVLHLRKLVKQNGYIIIDDSCLKNISNLKRKGYEYYKNYHESIKELTSFNDKIINEINTSELIREINYGYLNLIKPRAEELIKLHPELKSELIEYVKVQEEECKIIDEELDGWIWILQKTG